MKHKGLGNENYTFADWKEIPEDFIRKVVQTEGKRILAEVLGIPYRNFADWFKYRKMDIKVVRNFNYYNSRKKPEDRLPYQTDLSNQLKGMLEMARSRRLTIYKEKTKEEEVICPTCGKTFIKSKRGAQKYCSFTCMSKRVRTAEEKAKMSESKMGQPAWNKGIPATEEAKAKFHESIQKVWTPEKREEQRQIQKKAWSDPELLERHSALMTEVISNEETKEKIRNSLHEYYTNIDPEILSARYKKSMETKLARGFVYLSEGESSLVEYVKSLGFEPIKYVYGKGDTRFEIDCYIPELKIGIEYNGVWHHAVNGSNKRKINYHFKKSEHARIDLGIDLIQIWEDQWKMHNDIIKDIIRIRLGKVSRRIPARKCVVKEISSAEYRAFCDIHHIQGYRAAKVKLGLYYKDELVQIVSFGMPGNYGNVKGNGFEWEWIRACSAFDTVVVGGTSKLFKYFVDVYKPNNILCYSDLNLFNGNGYEKLGFEFLSYTGPDLFFIRNSSRLERINRNPYANAAHKQLVREGKMFECHGCGSKKFAWYKQ